MAVRLAGRSGPAQVAYGKALTIQQTLADSNPKVTIYRRDVVSSQNSLSDVLRKDHRPAEALAGFDRALAIGEPLAASNPRIRSTRPVPPSAFAVAVWPASISVTSPGLRRHTSSLAIWDRLATRSGEHWFETACCHAVQSTLAGGDGTGVPLGDAPIEADKAMSLLKKAVGMGYRESSSFRTESALDPLRSRLDFQLLMMDLALPDWPFAP